MEYNKLEDVARIGKVSLQKFFKDANISYDRLQKLKEDNYIPTYIKNMFFAFVENELKIRDDVNHKQIKSNFLERAERLGYEVKNDKVIFPLFGKKNDIEISDYEMRFVKIVNN